MISTNDVKKNYVSKDIKPGNVTAKINNITIEQSKNPKDPSNPEYTVFLHLETRPVGNDFVGFDKEFGNPAKGQYLGQTARVKGRRYPVKNYSGISKKTGKEFNIVATKEILNLLNAILKEAGFPKWIAEANNKFKTWDEMTAAIIRSGMLKDKYFDWCIGGEESVKEVDGKKYPKYYLHLPDYVDCNNPFAAEGGLVTTFKRSTHVIVKHDEGNVANDEFNSALVDESESEFGNAPDDDPFETLDDDELFELED